MRRGMVLYKIVGAAVGWVPILKNREGLFVFAF